MHAGESYRRIQEERELIDRALPTQHDRKVRAPVPSTERGGEGGEGGEGKEGRREEEREGRKRGRREKGRGRGGEREGEEREGRRETECTWELVPTCLQLHGWGENSLSITKHC